MGLAKPAWLPNSGLQIKTSAGETVKAAGDGQIVYADHLQGWGQTIIIEHSSEFCTVYANLQKLSISNGADIRKGEPIAKVASSENNESVLHFEIRKAGRPVDPRHYLN